MPKKKKTTTSGELVMVKSVHRTRSRRIKFLRSWGLGGFPQQAAPEAEWLSRGIACHLCWGNLSSMAAFLFDIYVYLWYIEINIRGEVKR